MGKREAMAATRPTSRLADFHIDVPAAPLVATAIHDGHALRPEVARYAALDDATRLREEDPWTRLFTRVAPNRVVGLRSRFEVDLNRPRDKAVYERPEDAWGLHVWSERPPDSVLETSRALHDEFYEELTALLEELVVTHGGFVLLDVHSYNHRRAGAEEPYDDPGANPEVNVGTGTVDRHRWGPLVDRFVTELGATGLDVRENVRFKGAYLSRFVNERFPTGCSLALEFKKTFMAEWTGEVDEERIEELTAMLRHAVPGLIEELQAVAPEHRTLRA
jgi:N-formylglutamate amidohydrolase